MSKTPPISQNRLRELVTYFPKTGVFTRNKSGHGRIKGSSMGAKHVEGYIDITIDGIKSGAHRWAWLYVFNEWPDYIDHIDRNPSNNQLSNLRSVTAFQNAQNTSMASDNTSGFTGVCKMRRKKMPVWRARIGHNGKLTVLGYFKTPEEAGAAYNKAKQILHI